MKFFILLFNFYILALSVVPCNDVDVCNENSSSNISTLKTKHKEDHKETDNCTPFCVCACCAVTSIYQPIQVYKITATNFITVSFAVRNTSYNSQNLSAIWQPPKFSV